MKVTTILLAMFALISCKEKEKTLTAQLIIDEAIKTACSGNCEHATIDFTFRDKKYRSHRSGGAFVLERFYADSTGNYKDVLTNYDFKRFKNDSMLQLADSTRVALSNSVNSVHYFAQLPFGLNAPAVHKELIGKVAINGAPYYAIRVTFSEEGGGTDFEDVFVYWIHEENKAVDYFAYSYEVNGGGIRFREAYNDRYINGIRFVDYNNYKPESLEIELTDLPKLFESGNLKLLSKIETENIKVAVNR
ncbi:DUF6503 family protein [Jejudonia soesokkakensis]|uniref:DUF6503 family protein n=1 Tax=Jejudonia soesokkakensis TaxID=1323432 RepID=A0ABW2MUN6_9FLAO